MNVEWVRFADILIIKEWLNFSEFKDELASVDKRTRSFASLSLFIGCRTLHRLLYYATTCILSVTCQVHHNCCPLPHDPPPLLIVWFCLLFYILLSTNSTLLVCDWGWSVRMDMCWPYIWVLRSLSSSLVYIFSIAQHCFVTSIMCWSLSYSYLVWRVQCLFY